MGHVTYRGRRWERRREQRVIRSAWTRVQSYVGQLATTYYHFGYCTKREYLAFIEGITGGEWAQGIVMLLSMPFPPCVTSLLARCDVMSR